MFGDIGDTRLGRDGSAPGLVLLGVIVGVVLRLLVVMIMTVLDGVVWDKQLREAELCLVYNTRGRSPRVL